MKKKEEVIKEAWGKYWDNMPHELKEISINNNGWIQGRDCIQYLGVDFSYSDELDTDMLHYGVSKQRPKSLQGIEDNNGWIRIESEEDLPKDVGSYLIQYEFKSGHKAITCVDFDGQTFWHFGSIFRIELVTHYQPIVKPKPPLY